MSKTLFQCISNLLLFTLFGLAFIFSFSEISQTMSAIKTNALFFSVLLIICLAAYFIVYFILAKKNNWSKKDDSELAYLDEREKIIVAESTKTAYKVLVGGLIFIIAAIGGYRPY